MDRDSSLALTLAQLCSAEIIDFLTHSQGESLIFVKLSVWRPKIGCLRGGLLRQSMGS
jgi:hypothetical protein